VNAQENEPEEKKAERGLRRHPAGLRGEGVGGEYRVDPEGLSSAVFTAKKRRMRPTRKDNFGL
jgi:hypothetical protein